ncbi:MAG: 4-aminobutyrate--2-oxoglutarate transaminase [Candidatus Marinimicrobia bacterium]|nr:4-aminobutyrate--2-oxoglutarate transaminase [Candidatus Neomarinimicrobiota bacterium]
MAVKINTSIPGPKSRLLIERRSKSVAKGHGTVCNVYIKKANGAILIDVDDNIFIDFAGGIGTMNVGHSHPKILDRVKMQLDDYTHTCFTVAPYESYIELAERLSALVPISGNCKAAFFNSGAEAVENAVKISRSYTKRTGILVFSEAYHGRTLMTMTMTYKEDPYKKGFGPFASEVYRLPYPSDKNKFNFNNLDFNPNKIACAVIEPVLGEGGFIPASKSGMKALEHFCKENGILLVIDEVQTGYGRTGSFFATEQFDVEPDIITVAKSIAGGLPLSGVIGKSEVMDSVHIGGIGGTYSGNPLACVAALEVLNIMESEKLSEKANEIGIAFRTKIDTIINKIPWVKEIRGIGAMMAIEIFDPDSGEPDKDRTSRIHQYALEHGLIMITAGTYGNIIRTLMPLNIDKATLSEGLEILCDALAA